MNGAAGLILAGGALAVAAVSATLHACLRGLARVTLEEIALVRGRAEARRRVTRILDDVDGHAASMTIPRIVAQLLVLVGVLLWVASVRGSDAYDAWSLSIAVGVAAVLLWFFGSVIPAAVARHAAERTVYVWSGVIRAVHVVLGPVTAVAAAIDGWAERLLAGEQRDHAEELQAELLSVVDEANREGQVDEAERDMIESVVRFRATTVGQIMTPRTEIEAIELTNDLGALVTLIRQGSHSRIPVYEENLDHIVGIFYVKDLMRWLAGDGARGGGKPFDLRTILRPAVFVPETKTIRELLQDLLAKKVHIAMVADEYGGTAGLVTIEDIVEEVFGEIWDEYEEPAEELPTITVDAAGRVAEIDAWLRIDEANNAIKALGVELPESEEYDTVGGFLLTELGKIPEVSETLRHGPVLITVIDAEPTRVNRVRVQIVSPEDEAGTGTPAGGRGTGDPSIETPRSGSVAQA